MLKNLYVFITIITTIVQTNVCEDFHTVSPFRPVRKTIFPVDEKANSDMDDVKFYEKISESTSTSKPYSRGQRRNDVQVDFGEIKGLLSKLLVKIQDVEKAGAKREIKSGRAVEHGGFAATGVRKRTSKKRKRKEKPEEKSRWGKWTDWSPCSVSCGKGREIRWRHCLENCEIAETEMEEKTCQLPACGPSKLFGVIKL